MAGLNGYGLCAGECSPVRQDCGYGWKCSLAGAAPVCYSDDGYSGLCDAGYSVDCPAGYQCVGDGTGYACYRLCNMYTGIGCSVGETCGGLVGVDQWGVCL